MRLDPTTGVPFYRQIEASLAARIRDGALVPDEALPSVRALAQELLVSVITVKQAYAALEAAGLVYTHQGRGTFVARSAVAAARLVAQARLREAVTAAVERARAEGLDDAEIHQLVEETCRLS